MFGNSTFSAAYICAHVGSTDEANSMLKLESSCGNVMPKMGEEKVFLNFASSEKFEDAIALAALLSPMLTITSYAVAQSSANPPRKELSDLLEELFLIRPKAEISAGDVAKGIQLEANI